MRIEMLLGNSKHCSSSISERILDPNKTGELSKAISLCKANPHTLVLLAFQGVCMYASVSYYLLLIKVGACAVVCVCIS